MSSGFPFYRRSSTGRTRSKSINTSGSEYVSNAARPVTLQASGSGFGVPATQTAATRESQTHQENTKGGFKNKIPFLGSKRKSMASLRVPKPGEGVQVVRHAGEAFLAPHPQVAPSSDRFSTGRVNFEKNTSRPPNYESPSHAVTRRARSQTPELPPLDVSFTDLGSFNLQSTPQKAQNPKDGTSVRWTSQNSPKPAIADNNTSSKVYHHPRSLSVDVLSDSLQGSSSKPGKKSRMSFLKRMTSRPKLGSRNSSADLKSQASVPQPFPSPPTPRRSPGIGVNTRPQINHPAPSVRREEEDQNFFMAPRAAPVPPPTRLSPMAENSPISPSPMSTHSGRSTPSSRTVQAGRNDQRRHAIDLGARLAEKGMDVMKTPIESTETPQIRIHTPSRARESTIFFAQPPEMNSPSRARIAQATGRSPRNSSLLNSPARSRLVHQPSASVSLTPSPSRNENLKSLPAPRADIVTPIPKAEVKAGLGVDISQVESDVETISAESVEEIPVSLPQNSRRHARIHPFSVSISVPDVSYAQTMHKKTASAPFNHFLRTETDATAQQPQDRNQGSRSSDLPFIKVDKSAASISPPKPDKDISRASTVSRASRPLSEHESSASCYSMSSYRDDTRSSGSIQTIPTIKSQEQGSRESIRRSLSINSASTKHTLSSSIPVAESTNPDPINASNRSTAMLGNIISVPDTLTSSTSSVTLHKSLLDKCSRFEKLAQYLISTIEKHEQDKKTYMERIDSLEKEARKYDREIQGLRWLVMNSSGQNAKPVDVITRKTSLYGFLASPPEWEDDDVTPTPGGESPQEYGEYKPRRPRKQKLVEKSPDLVNASSTSSKRMGGLLQRSNTMPTLTKTEDEAPKKSRNPEDTDESDLSTGLGLEFPMPGPLTLPSIESLAFDSPSVKSLASVPSLTTAPTASTLSELNDVDDRVPFGVILNTAASMPALSRISDASTVSNVNDAHEHEENEGTSGGDKHSRQRRRQSVFPASGKSTNSKHLNGMRASVSLPGVNDYNDFVADHMNNLAHAGHTHRDDVSYPFQKRHGLAALAKAPSYPIDQVLMQKDFALEDLDMDDMFGKLMRDLKELPDWSKSREVVRSARAGQKMGSGSEGAKGDSRGVASGGRSVDGGHSSSKRERQGETGRSDHERSGEGDKENVGRGLNGYASSHGRMM